MYLSQDRKLQPSTIDGYRSAIADKLGNSALNISKDENLTHCLESFHRDRPKGRRGIPSSNLSLVLHQLTKAPVEPIRDIFLNAENTIISEMERDRAVSTKILTHRVSTEGTGNFSFCHHFWWPS